MAVIGNSGTPGHHRIASHKTWGYRNWSWLDRLTVWQLQTISNTSRLRHQLSKAFAVWYRFTTVLALNPSPIRIKMIQQRRSRNGDCVSAEIGIHFKIAVMMVAASLAFKGHNGANIVSENSTSWWCNVSFKMGNRGGGATNTCEGNLA